MLTTQFTSRRSTALVTALLIAVLALPAAAVARPMPDPAGATGYTAATQPAPKPAEPAPVADDGTDVLPIVLAGAALIIVLCGTGYVLVHASHRRQLHIQH